MPHLLLREKELSRRYFFPENFFPSSLQSSLLFFFLPLLSSPPSHSAAILRGEPALRFPPFHLKVFARFPGSPGPSPIASQTEESFFSQLVLKYRAFLVVKSISPLFFFPCSSTPDGVMTPFFAPGSAPVRERLITGRCCGYGVSFHLFPF